MQEPLGDTRQSTSPTRGRGSMLRAAVAAATIQEMAGDKTPPLAARPSSSMAHKGTTRRSRLMVILYRAALYARPLLLPILARLEWRMRTAVEKSSLAASVERLDKKVAELSAVLQKTNTATVERLDQKMTELAAAIEKTSAATVHCPTARSEPASLVVPVTGELLLSRTRLGYIALPQSDPVTVAFLASGTLPEAGSLAMVERLLKPGESFIDVGANVGIFTLAAARAVGRSGRVLAIEPNPGTARALRTTVQINGCDLWTEIKTVAAGREEATVPFHVAPVSGHSSLYPVLGEASVIDVQQVTLDRLTLEGNRWSLVKIDVEGAELDVLAGMKRIVAENPTMPIIIEFGPSHIERAGSSACGWLAHIHHMGFQTFEVDDAAAILRPLRANIERVFSVNLLLVREITQAVADLMEQT